MTAKAKQAILLIGVFLAGAVFGGGACYVSMVGQLFDIRNEIK